MQVCFLLFVNIKFQFKLLVLIRKKKQLKQQKTKKRYFLGMSVQELVKAADKLLKVQDCRKFIHEKSQLLKKVQSIHLHNLISFLCQKFNHQSQDGLKIIQKVEPSNITNNFAHLAVLLSAFHKITIQDLFPLGRHLTYFLSKLTGQDVLSIEFYGKIANLIIQYIKACTLSKHEKLAIKPLRIFLLSQFSSSDVTILHANFAFLCLKYKMYNYSKPIIEQRTLCIKPIQVPQNFEPQLLDNYQYYRGLLFLGLNNQQRAYQCFIMCLNYPHKSLSQSSSPLDNNMPQVLKVAYFKAQFLRVWLGISVSEYKISTMDTIFDNNFRNLLCKTAYLSQLARLLTI